jgi:hypothetical protein
VSQELVSGRNFLLRIYVWLGDLHVLARRLPDLLKDAQERGDLYAATMLGVRNSYIPRLASDDAAGAREDARRAIERWPQAGFHTPHYVYACAATEIDLYCGEGREAWRKISELWGPLRRSLILRVQFALLEATHLHARAAVAASLDGGGEGFLRIAERDAARIEQEKMAWAEPLARLIRAAVAAGRGDARAAVDLLASAERQLEAAGMRLYAAAARYTRGELLGDSAGTALRAEAEQWMKSQNIHNPRRFARMLVPGNWANRSAPAD